MAINTKFNFCKYRYVALFISTAYILVALVMLTSKGMNWGIDFQGGIVFEIKAYNKDISQIRSTFKDLGYQNARIQTVGNKQNYLIKILPQGDVSHLEAIETIKHQLISQVGGNIEFRKVDYVGPKIGAILIKKGISAVVISLFGILVYVGFRFNFNMGLSAILALFHDMLAVFCFYVVSGLEFNVTSIAVILIILGYSINDSVVVFDRIRENLRKYSINNYLQLVTPWVIFKPNTKLCSQGKTIITNWKIIPCSDKSCPYS